MFDDKLNQANGRLKTANCRVRIQRLGHKLYLQATLPPKPGSDAVRATQQRIALGMSASPAAISIAEKEARKISALLDCKEFDWTPYLTEKHLPPSTIGGWVERFEQAFKSKVSEVTWETDYQDVFKRLNPDAPLTIDVLLAVIDQTEPDTRTRKRVCQALGKLATVAGIETDFKELAGNYSARRVDPRDLPDDEAIARFGSTITNAGWRWVYGAIATFGLRPHEAFFLDITDLVRGGESITVTQGKTHGRQVWAYYPEWIELFNLRDHTLPDVTGKKHADYGDRVTCYLRSRVKMPFKPYDLRHCWARRVIVFGLPDALASKQMGHSLTVHHQTYQCWIDAKTHQQVHDSLKARSDRPVAPL